MKIQNIDKFTQLCKRHYFVITEQKENFIVFTCNYGRCEGEYFEVLNNKIINYSTQGICRTPPFLFDYIKHLIYTSK